MTEWECEPEVKAMALRLCKIRDIDPEESTHFPHPEGYAVSRRRPRWYVIANQEIIPYLQLIEAVNQTKMERE